VKLIISIFIIALTLVFFIVIVPIVGIAKSQYKPQTTQYTSCNVSPDVLRFKNQIQGEAEAQGIGQYTDVLLSICMVESRGMAEKYPDIFQASESKGLPVNTLDTNDSIIAGVSAFKASLEAANYDLPLAVQCYNFGASYASYVADKGGQNMTNAVNFSREQARLRGWASYGDSNYSNKVLNYLTNINQVYMTGDYARLIENAKKFLGVPYKLTPVPERDNQGNYLNVDCSSFMGIIFKETFNIQLPRTCEMIARSNMIELLPLSQKEVGDMILYTGTYDAGGDFYTHISLVIDDTHVIEASGAYVKITDISNNSYFNAHAVNCARVKNISIAKS